MFKKSKVTIIASALLLVGLVLAVIGACLGGYTNGYYFSDGGIYVINEKGGESDMIENFENFQNIDITLLAGRIELIKSNKNAIEYELYAGETLDVCEVRNGTFTFKTKSSFQFLMFGSFKTSYIKLYYDENTNFNDVSIKAASGSINVDGLNAKKVFAKSGSGSCNLSNVKADDMVIDGTSGTIRINDIESGKLEIRSVSGGIRGENVTCDSIVMKNTSGGTTIKNLTTASTDMRGSSGSINLQGALSGKTYLSNISGSVQLDLTLPKSDYDFNLSSTSGSCRVDGENFKGSTGGERPNQVEAKTTSGRIAVSFS